MNASEEYIKHVLSKVNCDQELFQEVLCKTIISLDEKDLNEMKIWCLSEFGPAYTGLIKSCFGVFDRPEHKQEFNSTYQKKLSIN